MLLLGGLIAYGLGKREDSYQKRVILAGLDRWWRFVGVDRDSEGVKNVCADLGGTADNDDHRGGGSGRRNKFVCLSQRC